MPVFTPELIARYAQSIPAEPQPAGPDYRARLHREGNAALIGGNVADIATTLQAIHAGRATEANPLMRHGAAGMIATKAATTAAEAYLLEKLAKDHPKAAYIAALTLGGIGGALALHNSQVGK